MPVQSLDEFCFHALYGGSAQAPLLSLMIGFSAIGGGWALVGIVPLIVPSRTRAFGSALTATLVVTAVVVFILKATIRRPRPYLALHGILPLSGAPTDFSFPSGHAAGSFAFSAFLVTLLLRRREPGKPGSVRVLLGCAALIGCACAIGVSRVYLGVHFPGDVLAGATLGTLIGTYGGLRFTRAEPLAVR